MCSFGKNLLRDNHELLEGQTATGVGATVQDVLEGNGQDVGLLGTGEVGDVSVEGNTLLSGSGLGNSQGDTEDGVGTELALVGGSIKLVQELINLGLVLNINVLLDDGGGNDIVDVLDGVKNTCFKDNGLAFGPFSWMHVAGEMRFTYPYHPTWPCHHRGARRPRAGLGVDVSHLISDDEI
jgi:hypothetical protein